jgi:alanine racemase
MTADTRQSMSPPTEANRAGSTSEITPPAPDITMTRPAWVEVDLEALASNFRIIRADLPQSVRLLYVLKDEAYGQGAVPAARVALANGVDELAAYTLAEAIALRKAGITAPILLLGERVPAELPSVVDHRIVPCAGTLETARLLNEIGRARSETIPIHIKVNSGMNRFGFGWRDADEWAARLAEFSHLDFAGVLSHFAQSDEADKTFARSQIAHFSHALEALHRAGIHPRTRHLCNSGGFLDLPEAHLDMVRVGILALGVFPSEVCRRLTGLRPVLQVKAQIAAIQLLQPGDCVGYGMRYRAETHRRIAVLPLGYGDGFPRVRNEGFALIHGRRAPLVGGVAMDALTVDITDIPEARLWDEAVVMGRQGADEITAHDLARLKRSVSYDILVGWRARLPRKYRGDGTGTGAQPLTNG